MRFRRSRYYYSWQYAVVFISAFAWMYLRDAGKDSSALLCGLIAAVGFIVLELLIQLHSVNITKDGVDVHAPMKQSAFTSFAQLQDVASIDSHFSRLFRYGDVRMFTKEKQKTISGVHDAKKCASLVKRRMHGNA